MKKAIYNELNTGDIFAITANPKDRRRYRRDKEGATEIVNAHGIKDLKSTFKAYPFWSMTVYKEEG